MQACCAATAQLTALTKSGSMTTAQVLPEAVVHWEPENTLSAMFE